MSCMTVTMVPGRLLAPPQLWVTVDGRGYPLGAFFKKCLTIINNSDRYDKSTSATILATPPLAPCPFLQDDAGMRGCPVDPPAP